MKDNLFHIIVMSKAGNDVIFGTAGDKNAKSGNLRAAGQEMVKKYPSILVVTLVKGINDYEKWWNTLKTPERP